MLIQPRNLQDPELKLATDPESPFLRLCFMSSWLIISEREHPRVHSAFVRGRSTCQLQQSVRGGSVMCVCLCGG